MAGPATITRTAYQGDAYALTVRFWSDTAKTVPLDVSAGSFRAQIRAKESDTTALTSFAINTVSAATGVLVLSLTAVQTAALPRVCVWDLEDTVADQTYLKCTSFAVSREVSR